MAPGKGKKDDKALNLAAKLALDLEGGEGKSVEEVIPFNLVKPKKEISRAEKEKMFIVKKIEDRLGNLLPEARYDQCKGLCGIIGFLFTVAGGVMVLKSLSQTVLFASDPYDPDLFVVGCSFGLPCIIWFIYIFIWPHLPCSHCRGIKATRSFIHGQRRERKDPSLFNNMVAAANKFSEPPIIRTRLFAMFRKEEYTIVCHTMQEFQEIFHFKTGVEPSRQLIKLREPDQSSYIFEFQPEEFILDLANRGVVKDTLFWIYTKGGLEVDIVSSPDYRMKLVRKTDPVAREVLKSSVTRFNKGPPKKDELESELDNLIENELEKDRKKEQEDRRQAAEDEEDARQEAIRLKLDPPPTFLERWGLKEKKKSKAQIEAEDPQDEEYRKEVVEYKKKLFLKLNPPPVEEVKEPAWGNYKPPKARPNW